MKPSTDGQPPIPQETRVLVVEDEAIVALDIENKLLHLGYTPVGNAATGEDAIARAVDLEPDLVLMDIRLQGEMDGITAAGEIKERCGIPVVYLTAYGDDRTMARAQATDPFGYLLKPFQEKDLRTTLYIALYRHRTDLKLRAAQSRLEAKERRQATIAEIGIRALTNGDWPALCQEAASMVAKNLDVGHSAIFELLPDEKSLLLRAGVGWPGEMVGSAIAEAGQRSLPGYTLLADGPVVMPDLSKETRFQPWPVAADLGIVSALSVPIRGKGPLGALIASSTRKRVFTREEVSYLEAMARVIAAAAERREAEEQVRQQMDILGGIPDAVMAMDREGRVLFWNRGAATLFGYEQSEMLGQPAACLYPANDASRFDRELRQALAGADRFAQWHGVRKDGGEVVADVRATVLHDQRGEPARCVYVARPTTGSAGR